MLTRWNSMSPPLGHWIGQEDFTDYTDPFRRLRHEMQQVFSDFERSFDFETFDPQRVGLPRMALFDEPDAYVLRAELPGMSDDKLQLSVDPQSVTVSGERADDTPEGYSALHKERVASSFVRRMALPTKIEPDQADARLENGVLTLRLPKSEEARPRQIAIRS